MSASVSKGTASTPITYSMIADMREADWELSEGETATAWHLDRYYGIEEREVTVTTTTIRREGRCSTHKLPVIAWSGGKCEGCLLEEIPTPEEARAANREKVAAWRAANPEKARQQTREAVRRHRENSWVRQIREAGRRRRENS